MFRDGLRPPHLVGTEHQAFRQARFNKRAQMGIKGSAINDPGSRRHLAVQVRILVR